VTTQEVDVRAPALPIDLSEVGWEQLVDYGRQASQLESISCWVLGDLAVAVSRNAKFGDKALDKFAEEVDVSVGTLRNYRVVSEAYPRGSALRSATSFGVLRVFKDLDDREDLLRGQTWTYRAALEEIERRKKQVVIEQRQLEDAARRTKSEEQKRRQREKDQQRALEYDKREEPADEGSSPVEQLLGGTPQPVEDVAAAPDPVKEGRVVSSPAKPAFDKEATVALLKEMEFNDFVEVITSTGRVTGLDADLVETNKGLVGLNKQLSGKVAVLEDQVAALVSQVEGLGAEPVVSRR
jgi:hypothetical protein